MHDHTYLPGETIDEKVNYYFEEFKAQGKTYDKETIKKAIEFLSYKHADPLPKTESDTKPVLYVFRHGQTEDNAKFIFSGWRDPDITDKGKEQALVLAPKLANKKIHMLVASTQQRAIKTMQLAISQNEQAKNLEIHTDPRIKERSYGDLQGKSKLEYYLENPEGLAEMRRSFTNIVPGGESIEMVCKRVAEFCDEIIPLMREHKINVAISCHGNSIRGFRRYFEHLSDFDTAHVETPLGQDYLAYVVE